MSIGSADAAADRVNILRRDFLQEREFQDKRRLCLPFHGVADDFSALSKGGYLSVRGPRNVRKWMVLQTVRDAMMQHSGMSIVAILPRDSRFRWLASLHDNFSGRPSVESGGPPPGWDADWTLRVISAGESVSELASALDGRIDLMIVDGVECLSADICRKLVGSPLFDVGGDAHDALIAFARRSDAAVVGAVDTTSELLGPGRLGLEDGAMELALRPESVNLTVTRTQRGSPKSYSLRPDGLRGWVLT